MPNEELKCVEPDGTHGDMQDKFLDAKIRGTEIEERIKHMKRGKSQDIHGINIELISWGSIMAIDQLEVFFNAGKFPRSWNLDTLTPIFKKSDPHECKNYLTITVGSVLGKLYCSILERRLQIWSEKN